MPQPQEAILRHLRQLATQPLDRDSDRRLIQQFVAESSEAAFAAIVARHGPMVLNVCRSVLRHQQDAEDVFQATFLVLARKAAAIRKQESVGSWLHGVAYRLAQKARVQASRRHAGAVPAPLPRGDGPLDELSVREWQAILHEELQRLPQKYRAALLLCYWEGRTRDEAARQLGLAFGTLKEQLERARNLLRSRLVQRGLAPSAALFATLFAHKSAHALPVALITNTIKAGVLYAGKAVPTGVASVAALALAQGALRTVTLSKWLTTALLLFTLGTLGTGIGLFSAPDNAGPQAAVADQPAFPVQDQVPPPNAPIKPKPPDAIAPIKDADGAAWFKANRATFQLGLDCHAAAPVSLRFTTSQANVDKGPAGTVFLVTEAEAASVVQGLVDSGLWSRPDTLPELLASGRYLVLSGGKMWRLGDKNDDVSSRFIVQHLLKLLAGERAQALRTWLAYREKPAEAPPARNVVRRLDLTGILQDHPGSAFARPRVIVSEEDLADAFPKRTWQEQIVKQVDFNKEYLLYFAWSGPRSDTLAFTVHSAGKDGRAQPLVAFQYQSSPQLDRAAHFYLFAVATDAAWSVAGGPPEPKVASAVREIDLASHHLTAKEARGDPRAPTKITTRQALAGQFVTREWAQKIASQVDFDKEYLLSFRWSGSSGDTLRYKVANSRTGPIVVFRYRGGEDLDRVPHQRLFVFPKSATWKILVGDGPAGANDALRQIDLAAAKLKWVQGDPYQPTRIADAGALSKTFADKSARDAAAGQVNFAREYLLYFAWSGSGQDKLHHKVVQSKDGPIAFFRYAAGASDDLCSHHRLFVLPRAMAFRVAQHEIPFHMRGKPAFREIGMDDFVPSLLTADPSIATPITSAAEVAKLFPGKALRDYITDRVDFDAENLLYLAWSGGGGAKLTANLEEVKGVPTAVLRYSGPGNDAKEMYVRLFVIPFNADWKLVTGRPAKN